MIDRFGIHLGPLYIHFYALIIILGILAADDIRNETIRKGGGIIVFDAEFFSKRFRVTECQQGIAQIGEAK